MFLEAAQGSTVVAAQLAQNAAQLAELGARLRARPPRAVVTCARGSSDHAATYARYLVEALKTLDPAAVVTAELIDHKNAAVFKTEDDYTYVVMPLTRER